jgi:hypothetical protein
MPVLGEAMELVGQMGDVLFGIEALRVDDVDDGNPVDGPDPDGRPSVRTIGSGCAARRQGGTIRWIEGLVC